MQAPNPSFPLFSLPKLNSRKWEDDIQNLSESERATKISKPTPMPTPSSEAVPAALSSRRVSDHNALMSETHSVLDNCFHVRRFDRVGLRFAELSRIVLRSIPLSLNTKMTDTRKIIRDAKFLESLYANGKEMPLATQRLFEMLRRIDAFNSDRQLQENRDLLMQRVADHASVRILQLFHIAVAYHSLTRNASIHTAGARLQILEGINGHIQACHHTLFAELGDNLIHNLKSYFYNQLKRSVENGRPIDAECIYQMLLMGIPGRAINQAYVEVHRSPNRIQECVNGVFKELDRSMSLLNMQSPLYYLNNHTLLARGTVNFVDRAIESHFRDDLLRILEPIAQGDADPIDIVKGFQSSIEEEFGKIDREILLYRKAQQKLPGLIRRLHEIKSQGSRCDIEDRIRFIDEFVEAVQNLWKLSNRATNRDYMEHSLFSAYNYFKDHIRIALEKYQEAKRNRLAKLEGELTQLESQLKSLLETKAKLESDREAIFENIGSISPMDLQDAFSVIAKELEPLELKIQEIRDAIQVKKIDIRVDKPDISVLSPLYKTVGTMFEELCKYSEALSNDMSHVSNITDEEFAEMQLIARTQREGSLAICHQILNEMRMQAQGYLELQGMLIARTILPRENLP